MKRLLLAVRRALVGLPPVPRPGSWLMDGVSGVAARLPVEQRLNPNVVDDGGAIAGFEMPTVGRMVEQFHAEHRHPLPPAVTIDTGRLVWSGMVTRRPDMNVVRKPLPTPLPGSGQRRHG